MKSVDFSCARRRSREKPTNPFVDWAFFHPTIEIEEWRRVHESEIVEAFRIWRNLKRIKGLLTDSALGFCDECEAMKCYGSLYPICEPVLEKLLKAIEE